MDHRVMERPMLDRVLVTGMGGELGTRVTNLLEASPEVGAIVGIDVDPPRRRIPRAEFHRIDLRDRARVTALVREFDPVAVLHLGVYEPNARSAPAAARASTAAAALHALGAAAQCPSLQRIVVRSGIEVYGRGRGAATRPDESVVPAPTSDFGRSLLGMEGVAASAAAAADVPMAAVRLATVVGPHFPSPLGRYLRLPVVPVSGLSDLPFSLLHQDDAATALVAALGSGHDGPVNVVGAGAVTAVQAVRMGGRIPLPIVGPAWALARVATELLGVPLPDHVRELIVRGRTADGGRAPELLGCSPARTTTEVVKELYDWAEVLYLDVAKREAA